MADNGVDLLVRQLTSMGIDDFFYLVGGPMSQTQERLVAAGLRGIDVRDERAAAYAAVAYSRLTQRPGLVLTCSGPGTVNTVTGVAHAWADGAPVVVLGGSAAAFHRGSGAFQETDQVGVMRPITKLAVQVPDPDAIPDTIVRAFHAATSGAPGPVYVDLPSDVLYGDTGVPIDEIARQHPRPVPRPGIAPEDLRAVVDAVGASSRPVIVAGSGVVWSRAWHELVAFAERGHIPCYTTPITRGIIPEDHPLALVAARSTAFRDTDCLIVLGTRDNFVVNYLRPPVMNGDATVVAINIEPQHLSRNRQADVAVVADLRLALAAVTGALGPEIAARHRPWVDTLTEADRAAKAALAPRLRSDERPIHPLRLCAEVEALVPRDAVRVVDGHETLGFSRRAMHAYAPGHMLTPGVYGTMGVGVPFAIGAKVARPDTTVVAVTGDGAFGYHAMEIDTAVRHQLGIVVVVANNGGWTAGRGRPGRFLGFTDYSRIADVFGCHGAHVCDPHDLAPALRRAIEYAGTEDKPAIVNVTVAAIPSSGRSFSRYTRYGTTHYEPV